MIILTAKHQIPFQIDDDDYESVSQFTWCINKGGYPCTSTRHYTQNGSRWDGTHWYNSTIINLHSFLLGRAPNGKEWDHENRDPLDNRRQNLRAVTSGENKLNRNPFSNSGHKGISWDDYRNCYFVCIYLPKKCKYVGRYQTIEEAVAARDAAYKQYEITDKTKEIIL